MKNFLDVTIWIKNSRKNFGQHLLRNKSICKNLHFFLPNFGGRSKSKILNVKKLSWVQNIWFLSPLRSLVSTGKMLWTFSQEVQAETRQKKISWDFWQNFFILHGIQCVCYTSWNVAILLQNVVYDVNNKCWQY